MGDKSPKNKNVKKPKVAKPTNRPNTAPVTRPPGA